MKYELHKTATATFNATVSLCRRAFRIYEEIQKIEANEFQYQEQVRSRAQRPATANLDLTAAMTRGLLFPLPASD